MENKTPRDISIIMTSRNEYPSNFLTMFSFIEEFRESKYDWEIIVVDNVPDEKDSTRDSYDTIYGGLSKDISDRIKYIKHNTPGHWSAKNAGIKASSGKFLFFPDAHIIMSHHGLTDMLEWIMNFKGKIGGIHAMARFPSAGDWGLKEWKIVPNRFSHTFTPAKDRTEPEIIPTASTCCMLSPRSVFDELGDWTENFGQRGGGEAYMVWKHAICGYPHYMHHKTFFWHPFYIKHNYKVPEEDSARSYFVSAYTIGGEKWLDSLYNNESLFSVGKATLTEVRNNIITKCADDRDFINNKRIMTIEEYFANNLNN